PCAMQKEYRAEERAPKQPGKASHGKQRDAQNDLGNIVILRNPNVELVLGKIRHVARKRGRIMVHRLAHQDPSHVRPPLAIDRGVWIAFLIGILMMYAVRRHPENRPTLQRKRGAESQEIFHPLVGLVSAMRQQPVITHPDPEAAGYPPQRYGYKQSL